MELLQGHSPAVRQTHFGLLISSTYICVFSLHGKIVIQTSKHQMKYLCLSIESLPSRKCFKCENSKLESTQLFMNEFYFKDCWSCLFVPSGMTK